MFELVIDTRKISVRRREKITAGSVGIRVGFEFSSDWDGLGRTAVFETDRRKIAVVLTENTVTLPWEVCEEAGFDVSVGVYGTNGDGSIVIPTVWTKLETVSSGADCTDAENSRTPTASDVQQMSTAAAAAVTAAGKAQLAAEKAEELAADVKARADSGEFNGRDGINGLDGIDGYTPIKGVDYFDGINGIDGTSVTITGISESGESGGTSTVTFSDGRTLSVRNGIDGQGGSDISKDTVRGWGFADEQQVDGKIYGAETVLHPTWVNGGLGTSGATNTNENRFRFKSGFLIKLTGRLAITPSEGWECGIFTYKANSMTMANAVKSTGFSAAPTVLEASHEGCWACVYGRKVNNGNLTEAELAALDDVVTITFAESKFQPMSERVSVIGAASTDEQFPSAKAVWELFNSVPNAEGVGF